MNNLLVILKLLPAIIAAIKALEEALPDSGVGKQKLQAILDIVVQVDSAATSILPQLTAAISVLVSLFNSTGLFKTKAA